MAQGFKTGGRQKGTQNKVSGTIKEMISLSIRKELESLPTLLKKLEPKERIEVMIKLMSYLVPKANSDKDDPLLPVKNNQWSIIKQQMRNPINQNSKV